MTRHPPILFTVGLLLVWELVVRSTDVSTSVLPSPTQVLAELGRRGTLYWEHGLFTLRSIGSGLALAFVLAWVLAVIIAEARLLGRAVYPLLIASQAIPAVAVAPVLVMHFGYGIAPKMLIACMISFFPLTISISRGLTSLDEDSVKLVRTLGASRVDVLVRFRVPNALPFVFAGLRVTVVLATIGAVVAEWVGSLRGLGFLVLSASSQLDAELSFGAIVVICAIGLLLYGLVLLAERLAMPWRRL